MTSTPPLPIDCQSSTPIAIVISQPLSSRPTSIVGTRSTCSTIPPHVAGAQSTTPPLPPNVVAARATTPPLTTSTRSNTLEHPQVSDSVRSTTPPLVVFKFNRKYSDLRIAIESLVAPVIILSDIILNS